jgi:hypothetical protein
MARSISVASRRSIGDSLYDGELADTGGRGGIPKDRRSCDVRRDLLEQFQPFPGQTVFKQQKTGDVTAWLRQACHIPGAYWIDDIDEYNRHIVDQR